MIEEYKKLSDEVLVKHIQETPDARLFAILIDRYEKKIKKKCLQLVRDEDAAGDLTQEILIKVYLNIKHYNKEAKFSTWLYSIMNNTSIDYLRKYKKYIHLSISDDLLEIVENIADEEEEIEKDLSRIILNELFEKIPSEDKVILLLKYKDGFKIKDIQALLNLSESAVKMRLKRAREKIRQLYLHYK